METTTSKISKKLHDVAVKKIKDIVPDLVESGMDTKQITDIAKKYIETKKRQFYIQQETESIKIKNILVGSLCVISDVENKGKLNKTENIFSEQLKKRRLEFKTQFSIGRYRVDYLFDDWLVFEGDGPHHADQEEYDSKRDKYLEKMGYNVVRVSWDIVAQVQEEVIDEIEKLLAEAA